MPQKSTVLIFTTAYRPFIGGSEIAIEEIVRRLPNVFFDILTPRKHLSLPRMERFENGCIHRLGLGLPIDKFLFPILGWFVSLRLRPALIHAYQASHAAGAAWLYKWTHPKTPFILTIQEGKNLKRQFFLIRFFRKLIVLRADRVTAISRYLAEYVRELRPNVPVTIIPNGVDVQRFAANLPDQKNIDVITVSRLVAKNGIMDLVEAISILKQAGHSMRTLIIGDGPMKSQIRRRISQLGLENEVILAGEVSNQELPQQLVQAKIFVRPSHSEGLGISFLEAMAGGLPIIGTPVGGIHDFLHDKETGLMCRVGDPSDLAEKIKMLLADESLRERLAAAGRDLVRTRYDWRMIASQMGAIYHEYGI